MCLGDGMGVCSDSLDDVSVDSRFSLPLDRPLWGCAIVVRGGSRGESQGNGSPEVGEVAVARRLRDDSHCAHRAQQLPSNSRYGVAVAEE